MKDHTRYIYWREVELEIIALVSCSTTFRLDDADIRRGMDKDTKSVGKAYRSTTPDQFPTVPEYLMEEIRIFVLMASQMCSMGLRSSDPRPTWLSTEKVLFVKLHAYIPFTAIRYKNPWIISLVFIFQSFCVLWLSTKEEVVINISRIFPADLGTVTKLQNTEHIKENDRRHKEAEPSLIALLRTDQTTV